MTNNIPSLAEMIQSIADVIDDNAIEVAELDRAIGDGDHVVNLQRGLKALLDSSNDLSQIALSDAFMKMGMTLMSTMGGASGSLFGTLFISMAKASKGHDMDVRQFSDVFFQGVESVKKRGKADVGEKTMLDTLIPVALSLKSDSENKTSFEQTLKNAQQAAIDGMQSTKNMVATKGRASFLGDRSIGHIDAGARTSQLMICTIADVLLANK